MKLHIYLPDTAEFIANISHDAAMLRLLAHGKLQWQQSALDAGLCGVFGVSKQQDFPWAALARLGEQADAADQEQQPDQNYWLFASPVNLALMRDSFLLNAPVPLPLSAAHEEDLRLSLNQHFAADNLQFQPAPGGHWWLRLPADTALSTTSPYIAQGQNIAELMPQGADAARWRARLNEIQMLLHGHAVNQAREAQGELPVNSLWLHGGGVMPASTTAVSMQVYTDDASVQGLALLAGSKSLPVTDLAQVVNTREDALLVYPLQQWQSAYSELLLAALRSRKLHELVLYFAWQGRLRQLVVKPYDLLKFWRKPQAMEAYF